MKKSRDYSISALFISLFTFDFLCFAPFGKEFVIGIYAHSHIVGLSFGEPFKCSFCTVGNVVLYTERYPITDSIGHGTDRIGKVFVGGTLYFVLYRAVIRGCDRFPCHGNLLFGRLDACNGSGSTFSFDANKGNTFFALWYAVVYFGAALLFVSKSGVEFQFRFSVFRSLYSFQTSAADEHVIVVLAEFYFGHIKTAQIHRNQIVITAEHTGHGGYIGSIPAFQIDFAKAVASAEQFIHAVYIGSIPFVKIEGCEFFTFVKHEIDGRHIGNIPVLHIYFVKAFAVIEYGNHYGYIGSIPFAYIQFGKLFATAEHVKHVGYIGSVPIRNIETCQTRAIRKHTGSGCETGHVKGFRIDGLQFGKSGKQVA